MTTRQSFFGATKLHSVWNKVIVWNDYTIGTVLWHEDKEWKLLPSGTTFEQAKKRDFQPIATFHTQQELWQYIKEQA